MPKERTIIDYELIWKKIHQSLTDEEELLLQQWLNESGSHQHYFDETIRYYHKGSDCDKDESDTRMAWEELKIRRKSIHKYTSWIISLSAAAAVLLFFTWLFPIQEKNEIVSENKVELIKPGSNQATLILDDGSVLDLASSKNLQLSEGGSDINIEGTKLEYTGKSKIAEEIKYNTLSVPRGGEFFLQLADGTKVWLNSETVLRYPVQFNGRERKVELTGEAFFEVTRDEKVPFLVESGGQVVKVLGTEFNISSYEENPLIFTTLIRGSVEVFIKSKPEIRQRLAPNEQSYTSESEAIITKREVDPYQFTAWKDGRFVFKDQNLQKIMNTLSKWYNVEVVFAREDLKNIRFTGDLPRYSNFNEILTKIGKTNEVNFRIENKTITIN